MAGKLPIGTGCLLVSYDFTNGKDNNVVLVGQKGAKGDVTVINGFQGKEAEEIFEKLTISKERRN